MGWCKWLLGSQRKRGSPMAVAANRNFACFKVLLDRRVYFEVRLKRLVGR